MNLWVTEVLLSVRTPLIYPGKFTANQPPRSALDFRTRRVKRRLMVGTRARSGGHATVVNGRRRLPSTSGKSSLHNTRDDDLPTGRDTDVHRSIVDCSTYILILSLNEYI